jgi:hypothetical protein
MLSAPRRRSAEPPFSLLRLSGAPKVQNHPVCLERRLGADSRQVASLGQTLEDAVELAVTTPTHRLRAGLHKEL